jgi:metal-responsive CopG/Arc/MetJ family transcriptional regulator
MYEINRGGAQMEKSAKVVISLPEPLLKAVEKERKIRGESRSEFFRYAIENLLKQKQEVNAVAAHVNGYRTIPEFSEEIEQVHQTGKATLTEEPW